MKNKQAKWWNEAKSYLMLNDPIMKKIISKYNKDSLESRGEPFKALCRTIIGQQISVKAAASIRIKFDTGIKSVEPINIINFGEIESVTWRLEKLADFKLYLSAVALST